MHPPLRVEAHVTDLAVPIYKDLLADNAHSVVQLL